MLLEEEPLLPEEGLEEEPEEGLVGA